MCHNEIRILEIKYFGDGMYSISSIIRSHLKHLRRIRRQLCYNLFSQSVTFTLRQKFQLTCLSVSQDKTSLQLLEAQTLQLLACNENTSKAATVTNIIPESQKLQQT